MQMLGVHQLHAVPLGNISDQLLLFEASQRGAKQQTLIWHCRLNILWPWYNVHATLYLLITSEVLHV